MPTLPYVPISVRNIHTYIQIYLYEYTYRHIHLYMYIFFWVWCLDVLIMGKRRGVLFASGVPGLCRTYAYILIPV